MWLCGSGPQLVGSTNVLCGDTADAMGYHGLSCRVGPYRNARHNALNDIIKRALGRANVPARVEQHGLCKEDRKRPDGVTLKPWDNGRYVAWDVACVNTMCPTHLPATKSKAGAGADNSASRKKTKYKELDDEYDVVPIIVETLGSWHQKSAEFIKRIGALQMQVTEEAQSVDFLFQRLSIALQRGNHKCINATFGPQFAVAAVN